VGAGLVSVVFPPPSNVFGLSAAIRAGAGCLPGEARIQDRKLIAGTASAEGGRVGAPADGVLRKIRSAPDSARILVPEHRGQFSAHADVPAGGPADLAPVLAAWMQPGVLERPLPVAQGTRRPAPQYEAARHDTRLQRLDATTAPSREGNSPDRLINLERLYPGSRP
jgi:hypothetical protein